MLDRCDGVRRFRVRGDPPRRGQPDKNSECEPDHFFLLDIFELAQQQALVIASGARSELGRARELRASAVFRGLRRVRGAEKLARADPRGLACASGQAGMARARVSARVLRMSVSCV